VDATATLAARATILLERHGVLTREAVRGEGVVGGFVSVYPVLRAMEEAGRIRRGYFVTGLGGAQFALAGAVDRLRAHREERRDERRAERRDRDGGDAAPDVTVLAATDPANAYGLSLPWPVTGPQRVAGAYVVSVDGVVSLYLERGGRGLIALRSFDGQWERAAVVAICGLVVDGRLRRIALARYPEELTGVLGELGFSPSPKGLVRYARI